MAEGLTRGAENLTLFSFQFPASSLQWARLSGLTGGRELVAGNFKGPFDLVKSPLGDSSGGGTPGPIPNPVVKPASAYGTWLGTAWESRSLPRGFFFDSGDPVAFRTGTLARSA